MRSPGPRPAFTLIEVLVMVAVVVVLMSILLPALFAIFRYVDEMRSRREIGQLDDAVEAFKLRYGHFPPSQIRLREKGGYNDINSDELDRFTAKWLSEIFKKIDLELYTNSNGTQWHDWNGNGQPDEPVQLEGDECLVFFLGGIPSRDATTGEVRLTGFCPDKATPAKPTSGVRRDGPFFEFRSDRLAWPWPQRATATWETYPFVGRPNSFPVYLDRHGTPYVYFWVEKAQIELH